MTPSLHPAIASPRLRHTALPATTRFSGSDNESDNELQKFFPPKPATAKDGASKPARTPFLYGLFGKLHIYVNRPKLGKLQLAKLIDRLQASSQQWTGFKLLAYNDSDTTQTSRFQLDGGEFFLRYKNYKWPVPTPHDRDTLFRIKNFTGYRLKSADGKSTLRLDFCEGSVHNRGKLVYTNRKTGMKLVSTDYQILHSAQNLFSKLANKAKSDSQIVSRQDGHIPDLEM